MLSVYDRLGILDGDAEVPPRPAPGRRAAIARQAAAASIVLLRNAGILPLPPSVRRIAVVGPNADQAVIMGGGSAGVEPDHRTSPLEAIRAKVGDGVTVVHEPGVDLARTTAVLRLPLEAEYFGALDCAGDVVHRAELPATELTHLGPPVAALDGPFSVRAGGTFEPSETGRYLFTLTHVGRARVLVDGAVVLDGFDRSLPRGPSFMGLGCQELTGEVELDGGRQVRIVVEYDTLGAHGLFAFRVGCRWMAPADLIERAVAVCADADVVVVVVGTSNEWESEGFDRESLALPADQDELVRRVAAANDRTVVVVNTGAPVAHAVGRRGGCRPPGLVRGPGDGGRHRRRPRRRRRARRTAPRQPPRSSGGHAGLPHLSRRTQRAALRGRPAGGLPLVRGTPDRRHLPLRSRPVVHDLRAR